MGQQDIEFSTHEIKSFLGVLFITESCTLLGLSYQVRYKSLMLFHHFIEKIDFIGLCTASILLASKLEEEVCTLKRIVYVFNYLYTEYESKPTQLTSRSSIRLKERCILAETEILRSLGFNVVFEDVYGDLVDFIQSTDLAHEDIKNIISSFNTLIQWPDALNMNSKSLIITAIEVQLNKNQSFNDFLMRYNEFHQRKFNLETYEEIKVMKKIDSILIQEFIKRQKK